MQLTTTPTDTIDFSRRRARLRDLPLTSMIDIVFLLIFFFMLTTSFMRMESMELMLPSVSKTTAAKQEVARVVIHNGGRLSFGQRGVDRDELELTLQSLFTHNPNQQVVVYADTEVSMQELVEVMDMVQLTGGRSLYVRPLPGVVE